MRNVTANLNARAMTHLREILHRSLPPRAVGRDAICSSCGRYDPSHPDVAKVVRTLQRTSETELLDGALCICSGDISRMVQPSALLAQAQFLAAFVGCTLDNFTPRRGAEIMLEAARQFARREGPRVLTFQGRTGTGKTHLLHGIGLAFIAEGYTTRYTTTTKLMADLRNAQEPGGITRASNIIQRLLDPDLLLLDDLGAERPTKYAVEQLFHLIDSRFTSSRYTVVSTNLPHSYMVEALGDRIASRVLATALGNQRLVISTSDDYRQPPEGQGRPDHR